MEEIAHAMITLARNEPLRVQMGENGYQRVMSRFQMTHLQDTYETIYKDFADSMQIVWESEDYSQETAKVYNAEIKNGSLHEAADEKEEDNVEDMEQAVGAEAEKDQESRRS